MKACCILISFRVTTFEELTWGLTAPTPTFTPRPRTSPPTPSLPTSDCLRREELRRLHLTTHIPRPQCCTSATITTWPFPYFTVPVGHHKEYSITHSTLFHPDHRHHNRIGTGTVDITTRKMMLRLEKMTGLDTCKLLAFEIIANTAQPAQ